MFFKTSKLFQRVTVVFHSLYMLQLVVQHLTIKPNLFLQNDTSGNFLPLNANEMQVVFEVGQGVHNLSILVESWCSWNSEQLGIHTLF